MEIENFLLELEKAKAAAPKTKCQICKSEQIYHQRYPNAVCNKCCSKAIDKFGNPVAYCNTGEWGGFESVHSVGNEIVRKEDHSCWINEIECYSDEARFGGIVIETINKN